MSYDQRPKRPHTDTTRHLHPDEARDTPPANQGYWSGARQRSARHAETSAELRALHDDLDELGRDAQGRPTGMVSGGDVDIAYHYLTVAFGVMSMLYSVLGTIFAFHGGSAVLLAGITARWGAGPAPALLDALLNARTLGAVLVQVVLFVIMVGTRRNPRSWQHWAALLGSAALTYAGWSSLLLTWSTAPLTALTATIPAAVLGGALAWVLLRATGDAPLARPIQVGIVVAGVLAGALGVTTLIHGLGVLLAWSADQLARRMMVVG